LNQTPSAFHQFLTVMCANRADADGTADLSLRLVIFGGERLDPRVLARWMARHGDENPLLVNMYGITETTVHCTYRRITAADLAADGPSPIGVPLPDLRIELLDDHGDPVPDGEPGELYVAGPGLARGYLNRPELTEHRFVSGVDGARRYRSGDRAVRQPGGELFYLGRMDDQLKVRGYRIEPGEVEECLSHVSNIAGVVVTTRDFGDGDVRLVAYLLPGVVTRANEDNASEIIAAARRHAHTALPRHLRPASYEVVAELPMTLQGKVNRDALGKQAPHTIGANNMTALSGAGISAAEIRRSVDEIVQTVLERDDLDPAVDLFDQGATSLAFIRIVAQVNEKYGITVDVAKLDEASVDALSVLVAAQAQN
jgi:acyl-coenzyme A synthetase/AMP-(fatty) acid ligase/acyl carrier protein